MVFWRLQALLGMLGKLKRTLTQNLSEQKRTSDDKGIQLPTMQLAFVCKSAQSQQINPCLHQGPLGCNNISAMYCRLHCSS